LRAAMGQSAALAAALPELERAIGTHYQSQPPCC
jgi:hypothetical protein